MMAKAIVVYYSRTGNTERMAELIRQGIGGTGVEVDLKKVSDIKPETLLGYDAIVIGSPTYYGNMAKECKELLDESVKFHGKLDGKVGGAFSSSANIGGGNETTIVAVLQALLIHGMIVQGDAKGDHYGPVAINAPDERAEKECIRYGERIGQLTKKLFE